MANCTCIKSNAPFKYLGNDWLYTDLKAAKTRKRNISMEFQKLVESTESMLKVNDGPADDFVSLLSK